MQYPRFPKYVSGMYAKDSTVYVFPSYAESDLFSLEIFVDADKAGKTFKCTACDHDNKPIIIPNDKIVSSIIMNDFAKIVEIISQIRLPSCYLFYSRATAQLVEVADDKQRLISPGFMNDLFSKAVNVLKPLELVVIKEPTDLDKFQNVIFKPALMSRAFGVTKITYTRKD